MKKSLGLTLIVLLFFVLLLHGVSPQKWELQRIDDFIKGKFEGISVSYDSILSLSPKEEKIEGPAEEFYLSLLVAPEGVIFLGTGHGGEIYRITPDGKPDLYYKVPEMDVYCLAQDSNGNLYAGTSPNGKIYKITDKGKGDSFFDPPDKYIWDLLFTPKGVMLAAVGENGGIYEVNQSGEGTKVLNTKENHILSLKMDDEENLFASSGGNGLLYRVSKGYNISVLFESPFEEIKSIALDGKGNVFAAAGGSVVRPKRDAISPVKPKVDQEITITVTPDSASSSRARSVIKRQPSALYKVDSDGVAKELWSSTEDLIYSLHWNRGEQKLYFGTGSRGRVYAVDNEEKISLLIQKNSEQIYLFHPHRSKIYALSNNPSDLSIIYFEQRFSGEYTSHVYDTKTISSWGKLEWKAEIPSGSTLQFQTRSGNSAEPNLSWSDWSPPIQNVLGEQVLSPKARFIQFKAIFKTQSGKVSPLLNKVFLFYLQTNISPVITNLALLPVNEVFLKPPTQRDIIWGLGMDSSEQAKNKDKEKIYMAAKRTQRKGFQTFMWDASDANNDSLLYSVFIKGEDERTWRLLKDNWAEKIFAFDTLSFPDGNYLVKIVASDIPSNPLGRELKTEKVSSPLVIDNSLPVIKGFQAERERSKLKVSFSAEDSLSHIREAQFLIRPNEWRSVFPVDGICDSKQESFNFDLSLPANSDNHIVVKVWDSQGNVGVYRQSF